MRYRTNRWSIRVLMSAALAGFVLVAGCSKPPTRVGEGNRLQILHKGNKSDPQELDPHIVQGVPEHHILQALIENLVTEDPELRGGLVFDIDVRFGPLLRAERAVGPGHTVVEQHHVVLDHAKPLWLRIPARSGGILYSLQRRSL